MKKCFTGKVKFWKVMKICAVQAMIAMILVGVSMAHNSDGQLLETKITLYLEDVSLEKALKEIERVGKVKFVYSEDQLNFDKAITFNAIDQTLGDLLDRILEPYQINYKVHEKESTITLKRQHNEKGSNDSSDRGGSSKAIALITGHVTDATTSQSLAGVNVIIKGTASGTTTDSEGKFSIQVNDDDFLIFSFIGFLSFETKVNGRNVIDVVLQEDTKKLNEVIVNAGYWEVENKEQTGNISRITSKQIVNQPISNPLQALQGRMPGVLVTQLSGVAGDGFTIQIRGVNSIRGLNANEPLYIIDGVPFSPTSLSGVSGAIVTRPSPLNSINPADIESIEVLKDADATAIYGSRGANGVVLVTTKRGNGGKTKFDFNFYSGTGKATRLIEMLNTSQYVLMRKEAFKNDEVTPTVANAPDLLLWDTTSYTNWQKMLIGNPSSITNAQGSISGGNATTQFTFGGGYFRQTTVFPGDFNYQKGSTHFSLSHVLPNEKFVIRLTGSFISDKNNLPTSDYSVLALTLVPNSPSIYDQNGNLNWENGTWSNPYAELRKKYEARTKNLVTNANLSYKVFPGLRLKMNLGYNYVSMKEILITPIASQNPANNPLGSAIFSTGSINSWIVEPQVDYQRSLGQGKLTALIGTTFQQNIRDKQGFVGSGYTNDSQLENIAAAASITPTGVEYSEYKYNAIFGRLNYNWREKYIINLTVRRDGSSRFGSNRRFANFGAVGAAWIFSKENFISQNIPLLSFGKLRGSYGITGSDQIGDYQYLDTYSSTSNTYQGGKGLIPNRLVNPDFGWEANKKMEIGLELGILHDKLFLSASYYNNKSSNQLVGYSLPATTGFSSIQSNLPASIQNTGLELAMSTTNLQRTNFTWTTSFNVTFPQNKLLEYPNIQSSTYANIYKVGESLFIQKKYKSLGVDPQTGLFAFEDVDNNGILSSVADTQFIKSKTIDLYGGIQNSLSYKGFDLQFLFQFVKQTGLNYLSTSFNSPGARANQPTLVLNRWQYPGDITDIQKFTQAGAAFTSYISARTFGDGTLSDASFIRLQNLSLSWTLPEKWSGKIKTEKIRIYFQGQNLVTITNYQGSDPETQSLRALTPLRVLTLGAQITF